jgi:hypothetical protein
MAYWRVRWQQLWVESLMHKGLNFEILPKNYNIFISKISWVWFNNRAPIQNAKAVSKQEGPKNAPGAQFSVSFS